MPGVVEVVDVFSLVGAMLSCMLRRAKPSVTLCIDDVMIGDSRYPCPRVVKVLSYSNGLTVIRSNEGFRACLQDRGVSLINHVSSRA